VSLVLSLIGRSTGEAANPYTSLAALAKTSSVFVTFGEQERSRWFRGIMEDVAP
jgi:hypothetical protein